MWNFTAFSFFVALSIRLSKTHKPQMLGSKREAISNNFYSFNNYWDKKRTHTHTHKSINTITKALWFPIKLVTSGKYFLTIK